MNPNEMQQQDLSPDEAMANLAFATNLQEQVLKMGNQEQTTPTEGEIGAEMPLNGTETPQVEETPVMEENTPETTTEDLKGEFEDFKKQTKKMIKEEIGSLKDMIKESLTEEEDDKKE